jgi:hypothetical protein
LGDALSSWKSLAWAKDQKAGSPLAKCVLLLIAERADERYSCWPGVPLLAEEAEASERGVRKVLRELEARGLITVFERRRANRTFASNRYYLNHPEAPHMRALAEACPAPEAFTETPRVIDGGEFETRNSVPGTRNSVPGTTLNSVPPLNNPQELPPSPKADRCVHGRRSCRACGTSPRAKATQERADAKRRPEWCGECEPTTRLTNYVGADGIAYGDPELKVRRCPSCSVPNQRRSADEPAYRQPGRSPS